MQRSIQLAGTVNQILRASKDIRSVLGVFAPIPSQVRERISRTGELSCEPAVAGVTHGAAPVAVHRAVLLLPSATTAPIPVWRNRGGHCAAFCRTGVLWSKQKLRLSSFRLFWICLLAVFSNLLVLTMTHDK